MRMTNRWARLCAVSLALTLTASYGCGPRDRDRAADDALRVSDVTLGRSVGADNRVTDRTTTFAPRDTVYAAVETDRSATGGTLTARWTFEDGQVVDETTRNVSGNEQTVTRFHIVNPAGWPAGRYRLHVLVNGDEVETEEFTVRQ
jgi:hypothetical protein